MNKTILVITAALCAVGAAYGAKLVLNDQDATKVGLPGVVSKCNANFTELYSAGLVSNVSVALTRQASPSVTNATVGGGALGGITTVITNVTIALQYSGIVYDVSGTAITNGVGDVVNLLTNVVLTLETGTASVSSPTITLQTAPVAALTNAVLTIQRIP